jgi:hypothetical protein
MNVDLPAPLSPRTHVTSLEPTPTLMSFSATTFPKYFETCRTSSSVRWPLVVSLALIAEPPPHACGCSC